jgi:hypothetical protein
LTLPNFIVIGAAKAGTTALYWYLAEHPSIYMSPVKETNYFAYGVDDEGRLLWGDPEIHRFGIRTRAEYEALFADAGKATAVGEASTMYLECPQAAGRIKALIPGARIICGLRDPVDRAYSDYQMFLRNRGRRLEPDRDLAPDAAWVRADSHWMKIGRYHEQLARYYELFPRERIHIFLFDDLQRNTLAVVQELYRFLGVDPAFVPDLETPHNVGGMPSSVLLERILTNRTLRAAVQPWMSTGAANWFRRLRTKGMRKAPSLPPALKAELRRQFHDDISRTSALIGRNLDHWRGA